jgi:choline dehydrogenase-like flavoprotein
VTSQPFDLCVIGTGIGGATLLHFLAEFDPRLRIAIVEAGNANQHREDFFEPTGIPFKLTTTSIQLGGTSNLWHGVLGKLDSIDFKQRDWIPHSGWPIGLSDLEPYYRQAAEFYGIEQPDWFDEPNLSPELARELASIELNRDLLKNKLFQQPLKLRNLKKLIQQRVKSNSNLQLILNGEVVRFRIDTTSNLLTHCHYVDEQGALHSIAAKKFILCAGALESPRILLNSTEQGNRNVGRFLMDHPMGNLLQVEFKVKQKTSIYSDTKYGRQTKIKSGLVFREEVQARLRLPNHNFFFRPSFVRGINNESEKLKLLLLTYKSGNFSLKTLAKLMVNFNVIRQILIYKLLLKVNYTYSDLFFVTEQVPNWNSYVGLSPNRKRHGYPIAEVHWSLTDYDRESMKKIYRLALDELFPPHFFDIVHTPDDYQWDAIFTSGAHHVGTLRMAQSPRNGVIDKHLRSFDFSNLFVCDGSIFPTSGNVNVGLSISAFAIRLAEHLTGRKIA